jgi:hypothetical protein
VTLDKARKHREKRLQRAAEWEELHEEKKCIDLDNPEDLERIEEAKVNMGDMKVSDHQL